MNRQIDPNDKDPADEHPEPQDYEKQYMSPEIKEEYEQWCVRMADKMIGELDILSEYYEAKGMK